MTHPRPATSVSGSTATSTATASDFAAATSLSSDRIAEVVEQSFADDEELDLITDVPYNLIEDEQLGVTLLFTQHAPSADTGVVAAAERHALHAVVACLTAELTTTSGLPPTTKETHQ